MKRVLLSILAVGILLLSAYAVLITTSPTQQQTYTLSVSISPSGAGSVSPSSGEYEPGVQVTLTATPASGYTFDYWDGDASGSSAAVTIIMDSDKTILAHFADTTLPVISEVDISDIAESSATITWITDEPATSQIEYGKTTSYGSTIPSDEGLVTSHNVTLSDLEPNTTYHFRVRSKDATGNEGISGDFTLTTSKGATEVGGIISSDTTWTQEDSPYVITSTIQIPSGVTLTIEPGVLVTMPSSGDMFLLHGTIVARGTKGEEIIFDGGNSSNFFSPKGSSADTFLDLDRCILRNGRSFWPATGHEQYGHFSLTHCELINLTNYSYIWYPERDVHIEYNKLTNTGGFSIGHSGNTKVYIRYNLFNGRNPNLPSYADYWIQNWASYDLSETIVKYNSFINTKGIALELPSGYDSAAMSATENYWGMQDTTIIDKMIYDKNDDITSAGYINYQPILTSPHPSTPTP